MQAEYVVGVGHFASAWIPQESTFWRRSLWDSAGGYVEESLELAGDFELWSRFYEREDLYGIDSHIAAFRRHDQQKTALRLPSYVKEADAVFLQRGGAESSWARALLRKCVSRLPAPGRSLARAVRLAYPGRIIVQDGTDGRWRLVDTVV
jgi:hypothetical protein